MLQWNILQYLTKILRRYFNCNERLEIFLTCLCNILCYVGTSRSTTLYLVTEWVREWEWVIVNTWYYFRRYYLISCNNIFWQFKENFNYSYFINLSTSFLCHDLRDQACIGRLLATDHKPKLNIPFTFHVKHQLCCACNNALYVTILREMCYCQFSFSTHSSV